jgi:hypothetical protein
LEVFVGKIIFALLTVAIAWILFKGLSKKSSGGGKRPDGANPKNKEAKNLSAPEQMVKCARCGVFMPEAESLIVDGKVSCRDPQACAHGRA